VVLIVVLAVALKPLGPHLPQHRLPLPHLVSVVSPCMRCSTQLPVRRMTIGIVTAMRSAVKTRVEEASDSYTR
jgi:hypothetical protein